MGSGRLRNFLSYYLKAGSLKARTARSSILSVIGFGGQNLIRLASNLILTRILFPEAFGLMALVGVVQTGLQMFSDIGLRSSVIQNERGGDPEFLNTTWVLQIGRGIILWMATAALAIPAANFYEAPLLAWLLPVTGLNALILGFASTKMMTANRELMMGRVVTLLLGCQFLGVCCTIALALWLQSVWAIVLGGLVNVGMRAILSHFVLTGSPNRFVFNRDVARQLIGFGKYVFFATLGGFIINQADRAILGKLISLDTLALYSIGLMLAMVPRQLVQAISTQVIFPLYARRPPAESAENRRKINVARRLLTGGALSLCSVLALIGVELVEFMYDPRYEAAGPMAVLLALSMMPSMILISYYRLPMSVGNSKRFAIITLCLAFIQLGAMVLGATNFGLGGVAIAPGVASVLFYPVLIWLIRPYKGWDPVHDACYFSLVCALATLVYFRYGDQVLPLFTPF